MLEEQHRCQPGGGGGEESNSDAPDGDTEPSMLLQKLKTNISYVVIARHRTTSTTDAVQQSHVLFVFCCRKSVQTKVDQILVSTRSA